MWGRGKSAEQSVSGSEEVVLREWGKEKKGLEPYSKQLQYHMTTHWLKENLSTQTDERMDERMDGQTGGD